MECKLSAGHLVGDFSPECPGRLMSCFSCTQQTRTCVGASCGAVKTQVREHLSLKELLSADVADTVTDHLKANLTLTVFVLVGCLGSTENWPSQPGLLGRPGPKGARPARRDTRWPRATARTRAVQLCWRVHFGGSGGSRGWRNGRGWILEGLPCLWCLSRILDQGHEPRRRCTLRLLWELCGGLM